MVNHNDSETYHRQNPSLLTDQLYLAAARAISSRVLLDLGITCIINATLELPTMAYQKQDAMQIAVEDRVASKLYVYFDVVADKIHSVHQTGGKVMIYCRAGMSRSASLCIAYFMRHHGLTLEDAYNYVRERRPIIHPNVGFMRQLREYEAKLKLRMSRQDLPSQGVKRKRDSEALSYAEEQELCDEIIVPEVKDIPPRPKPRVHKPKLVDDFLHSALITQVHVVGASPDLNTLEEVASLPLIKNLLPKSLSKIVSASSLIQGQTTATRGLSETLPVAASKSEMSFEDAISFEGSLKSGRCPTKKPFVKISEPGKIAVSSQIVPMGMASSFAPGEKASFSRTTSLFSVFAEVHRFAAQELETVLLECAVSDTIKAVIKARAFVTLVVPDKCVADQTAAVTFDNHGVYQRQQIATAPTPQPQPKTPKIPSRFSSTSSSSSSSNSSQIASRFSSSRTSIKMPGVKISLQTSQTHTKSPIVIEPVTRCVASTFLHPMKMEKVTKGLKAFVLPPLVRPKRVLYVPDLSVASKECVLDTGSVVGSGSRTEHQINFKLARLLTVPKRTLLLHQACPEVLDLTIKMNEEKLAPQYVMPAKEYPYYSPSRTSIRTYDLPRATQAPAVESTWFFSVSPRKASQEVPMVPKVVPAVVPAIPKMVEPELKWAAERCMFFGDCLFNQEAQVIKPLESGRRAIRNVAMSPLNSEKIKNTAVKVTTTLPLTTTGPLKVRQVKGLGYPSISILGMCVYPIYEVASSMETTSCNFTNMFCEPTPWKTQAKSLVHSMASVATTTVPCKAVATWTSVEVIDNSVEELVAIPDVLDVNELKPLLMSQKDSKIMSIWLEVFKQSVMRARPIFPFVSVTELLPVGVAEEVMVTFEVAQDFHGSPIYNPIRGRALPTTSEGQGRIKRNMGEICMATEVTECFLIDVVHPKIVDVRPVLKWMLEKCSESRTYIFNYNMVRWTQPIETAKEFEGVPESIPASSSFEASVATSSVILNTPVISGCANVFGKEDLHSNTIGAKSIIHWFQRKPFQVVTQLKPVAGTMINLTLSGSAPLPSYQFVQDIEEQPDCSIVPSTLEASCKAVEAKAVDSLWYFNIDSPPGRRRSSGGSSMTSPSESEAAAIPAKAGKFQLFLPDPDMIDRLAIEALEIFEAGAKPPELIKPDPNIIAEEISNEASSEVKIDTSELVQGSTKERKKRVMIADPPVSSEKSPATIRRRLGSAGKASKLISYQRSKDSPQLPVRSRSRSASRRRRKEEEDRQDRQTMYDLQSSMQQASVLLDKRRSRHNYYTAEVSSSTSTSLSSPLTSPGTGLERGRPTERYSTASAGASGNPRLSSSSSSSTTESPGLRGLLDIAQSWLFSHTSRTERSSERSASIIRRTSRRNS